MLDCVDHPLVVLLQVEKAPTVVKAGLKKEEAEELKKKLEAGACSANAGLTPLQRTPSEIPAFWHTCV